MSISWMTPAYSGGHPILRYQISLTSRGRKSIVVNSKNLETKITGLANATTYNVSVKVVTSKGKSSPTEVSADVA